MKNEINRRSDEWDDQVKRGGDIDPEMVNATVTNLLNETLEDELNSAIGDIIQNYRAQQISTANANLTVGELSK